MDEFPEFMKNPINAAAAHQTSDGVEGFIYDGADGSQVVVFQCARSGVSKEHVHNFDEYFVVLQGEYTLGIAGRKISLKAGEEYYIARRIPHDGVFIAGTRTINVFGGKRATKKSEGAL